MSLIYNYQEAGENFFLGIVSTLISLIYRGIFDSHDMIKKKLRVQQALVIICPLLNKYCRHDLTHVNATVYQVRDPVETPRTYCGPQGEAHLFFLQWKKEHYNHNTSKLCV